MGVKVVLNNDITAGVTRESTEEISLDFSFDNFSPNFEILEDWLAEYVDVGNGTSSNSVSFIKDWIKVNGIKNNIPTKIIDDRTGAVIMDAFTDLTDPTNQYDELKCIYKLAVKNRISSFAESLEGLNLRSLADSSAISGDAKIRVSDLEVLKYVRSQVPDFGTSALLSVTFYLLGVQLIQQTTKVVELFSKAATTPAFAFGVGGALLWWGIEVIANLAILAFLIIAIVGLLKDISDLVFSKPTPVYTVGVKTLFEKGCKELGYTFESTLFDGDYANLRYLAAFNYDESSDGKRRVTTPINNPIPNISLGNLFEKFSKFFNAKTRITDDKRIIFENRDFFIKNPTPFNLPALKNEGTYTYNLSELPRSIRIKFAEDPVEKNTLLSLKTLGINVETNTTSSKGDQVTASYELVGITNKDLSPLKKEIDVDIDMARAYRKTQQENIEKLFNSIWDITQLLTGKNENNIGDRIGFMLLDGNFMGTDKILIQDGQKISSDNFRLIHAETLYSKFWNIESPAKNQWKYTPIEINNLFAICLYSHLSKIIMLSLTKRGKLF